MDEAADVVVVGCGNAGICAAIAAREAGATVTVLERAPRHMRGGNSRHTRDIRHVHSGPDQYVTGSYSAAELLEDLRRVTHGGGDPVLSELTARESESLPSWMEQRGVRWQHSLHGTLHLSRTNRFMLGGGRAMLNSLYRTAEAMGVAFRYETAVDEIDAGGGSAIRLRTATGTKNNTGHGTVTARAVVFSAGGFEANLKWLSQYRGEGALNYIVRGTPYNDGLILRRLLDLGCRPAGNPANFHGTAVDARAPAFDGGIVTRLDSVPFGVVVNNEAERFYDEGEELWPKRYAIWGGMIGEQPDQVAYSIFDSKSDGLFMPSVYPAYSAPTLEGLADQLGLSPERLRKTVDSFNQSVPGTGTFDPSRLDGLSTSGLEPPKTNWARALDTPPYLAYPLRPGITFTYLGVEVTERAQIVRDDNGEPFSRLFAAGELMAGNILSQGYLAGFGLTIGAVFGRIAGKEAASRAQS
ncbi:MAG TPA: FAD-dependent tricarballylate dehydrogenase TcuA [Trebonia sp.]|nr:FAD-dependent tricarballylate dehydrogenase TcuA [Trebonia sp.]